MTVSCASGRSGVCADIDIATIIQRCCNHGSQDFCDNFPRWIVNARPKLAPALANYAKEYPTLPITAKGYKKSHDRFLIVDNTVWHIGASLKDAGSALFAIMRMELAPAVILGLLP